MHKKNIEELECDLDLAAKVEKMWGMLQEMQNNTVCIPMEIVNDGQAPMYANRTDAGADIMANEEIALAPGESRICKTGVKVAIPEGFEIQVRPRSGISSKTTLRVANAPGTIDAGYRGEIGVILFNDAVPVIRDSWSRTVHGCGVASFKDENAKVCDVAGKAVENTNYPDGTIVIHKGDRIAQLVLAKVYRADFYNVGNVDEIGEDRGGGFGHSGIN